MNQCPLRHSSRSRPLKLSMWAFCTGLPGSMKCGCIPMSVRLGVNPPGEFRAVVYGEQLWQATVNGQ